MKAKQIAGTVFFASLFSFIVIWGYLPRLWLMSWLQLSITAVSVLSLLAWALLSLEALTRWIKKRATHYWIDLALKTVAVIVVLGVINWVAVDRNWKKDFTVNKLHSLSDQSVKVLRDLKEPVTLTVWSANVDEMTTNISARKFFENYKIKGQGKLTLEIKNPIEDPLGAEKANVQKKRHLVIVRTASGREARVENFTDARAEELVTNAILQASKSGRQKTICFITGHNELSTEITEPVGISILKEKLTTASYLVKEVALATLMLVPPDCDALALVGPQGNPTEKEPLMVTDYLEHGGQLIAFLGAGTSPVWKGFLKKYGIEVRNDLVIDPNVQPPVGVLTKNFSQDVDITKGLNGMALMLQSSSINVASESPDRDATLRTFISSEAYTYSKEGNLKALKDLRRSGADRKGPLPLAVLFEKKIAPVMPPLPPAPKATPKKTSSFKNMLIPEAQAQDDGHNHSHDEGANPHSMPPPNAAAGALTDPNAKEMSIIVFGNHYFVNNGFLAQFINLDLVLNSFNYVLKDKGEMGLRPREIRQATLQLTNESINQVMATLAILGLLFVVGALWAQARRKTIA